jgi:hypothetical protein
MVKLKPVLAVSLIVGLLLFGIGCTSSENITAGLGGEFTLPIGKTVSIQGESLQIRFVSIIGDSRCASGVECFWQGEVDCKMEITYKDSSNTKVLTQPGLTSEPAVTNFADYRLQFNVQPYPQKGETIRTGDYRLQMVVTK